MVFDTGVLLELAVDSPRSRGIRDAVVSGEIRPVTGELNVAEMRYILCRRVGAEAARRAAGLLLGGRQVRVMLPSPFLERAAEIKCARRISFVDCVTVAMGESMDAPVLFARRDAELSRELSKSPFGTKIRFLQE